jgi:thioesterase domain-containing protein
VDFLEMVNADVEMIKEIIKQFEGYATPNYNQLSRGEIIKYLNIGRSFNNARAFYLPTGKINGSTHYFKASQSEKIIPVEIWNHFLRHPLQEYEIIGDHYSILQEPAVNTMANILDEILESV